MPLPLPMSAGLRPHRVTLDNPGPPVATSDGGFTESVVPLQPPTMFASILPVLDRDVERAIGGTVLALATHRVTMPWHPQVTIQTRIHFNARTFSVISVANTEERNVVLELICTEVMDAPSPEVPPVILPYDEQVIADGATHYWRLNEPSGTIAADRIGFAHGTISGGVTLAQPGALSDGDKAMTFNGTTGKIVVDTSVTIPLPVTIELWLKAPTAVDYSPLLSNRRLPGGAATNGRFELDLVTQRPGLYAATGGQATATTVVTDGNWHHVVYLLNGTVASFYVDGVAAGSGSMSLPVVGTGTISLGEDDETILFFTGTLDDVAIYPVALTPAQIAAHYAAATQKARRR